jgi:hypothetical protein
MGVRIRVNEPSARVITLASQPNRSVTISDVEDFSWQGITYGRDRIVLLPDGSMLMVSRSEVWSHVNVAGEVTRLNSTMPGGRIEWARRFTDGIVAWYRAASFSPAKVCHASLALMSTGCYEVADFGGAALNGVRTLVQSNGSLVVPSVKPGTVNHRPDTAARVQLDLHVVTRSGARQGIIGSITSGEAFTYHAGRTVNGLDLTLPLTTTAFAAFAHLRELNEGFVLVEGVNWEVRVLNGAGTLQRIIRSTRAATRPTARDSAWFLARVPLLAPSERLALAPALVPTIGAIDVDTDQRIWVRDYRQRNSQWSWVLLARDGSEVGTLLLPSNAITVGFTSTDVALIRRDASGREVVQFYRYQLP